MITNANQLSVHFLQRGGKTNISKVCLKFYNLFETVEVKFWHAVSMGGVKGAIGGIAPNFGKEK